MKPHVLMIALFALGSAMSCSKNDEDTDSVVDDDDSHSALIDDDDSIGDDDTAAPCDYQSCDDIDVSGFGAAVAWETLVCSGYEMHGNDFPFVDEDEVAAGTYYFDNQEDLDGFISPNYPCPVGFGEHHVAGAVTHDSSSGGDYINVCGVYESEEAITIVYYSYVFDNDGTADWRTPHHFVKMPATDKTVSHDIHECVVWDLHE